MDTFIYKFDSENPFFRVGEFFRVSLSHHFVKALSKCDTIEEEEEEEEEEAIRGSRG